MPVLRLRRWLYRTDTSVRYSHLCHLAGEEGLEPSHAGIKIRCLYQLGDSPTQEDGFSATHRSIVAGGPLHQGMGHQIATNFYLPARWGAGDAGGGLGCIVR